MCVRVYMHECNYPLHWWIQDGTTLEGLKLQDGDKLAVEKHVKKG